MNTIFRIHRMTFVVLLTALFCTLSARGQESNSSNLPASLPIGGDDKLAEYLVTNTPPNCEVRFTLPGDTTGTNQYNAISIGGIKFKSFAEYRYAMATQAWHLYTNVVIKRTDIKSAIRLDKMSTYFNDRDGWLEMSTNSLGFIGQIDFDTILKLPVSFVRVAVAVTNLTYYRIDVVSYPPYSYTWTPTGQWVEANGVIRQIIETETNKVRFHSWYGTNAYRSRITMASGNRTNVYTQDGALICGARQKIDQNRLEIDLPKGVNAFIEYQPTLGQDWILLDEMSWDKHCSHWSVPIDMSSPSSFFRIRSE
jgi:hypothetical protein